MPSPRRSYHTNLKSLARKGLLPRTTLCQIPRTNLHRWKKESEGKYIAFGYDSPDLKHQELLNAFAQSRLAKRVFAAYVRIIKTVLLLAHRLDDFHKLVKEYRLVIVQLVTRVKSYIRLKRALHFFDISVPTFRQWSVQSKTSCFESLTGDCNRVYPNQLSRPEIVRIKDLLLNRQFQYWPVSSIAFYALRNNILPLSLNTWYKYVHKLGLSRPQPESRRKKNEISIRAVRPNQLWHADITQFVSADRIKHYIYLVTDNFSRKILAWKVADRVSSDVRRTTLELALLKKAAASDPVTLLTDGGWENAAAVHDLSPLLRARLVHHIAGVDVLYSNSLIEAHNKILKYNYLYRMTIPDGSRLVTIIPEIVDDFNNRPHISLNGLTPNEAIRNSFLDRDQNTQYIQQARQNRKLYNEKHRCDRCKK